MDLPLPNRQWRSVTGVAPVARTGTRGPPDDSSRTSADHQPSRPGGSPAQGLAAVEPAADDGPQDDRPDVPDGVVHLVHRRRADGDADARRAGPAGAAVPVTRAVQPAV